jgi:hypothetical protein
MDVWFCIGRNLRREAKRALENILIRSNARSPKRARKLVLLRLTLTYMEVGYSYKWLRWLPQKGLLEGAPLWELRRSTGVDPMQVIRQNNHHQLRINRNFDTCSHLTEEPDIGPPRLAYELLPEDQRNEGQFAAAAGDLIFAVDSRSNGIAMSIRSDCRAFRNDQSGSGTLCVILCIQGG